MESLASQLEQNQSIAQLGLAQQQSLMRDVLVRWAHLLILRSTRQPMAAVHSKAGELFARAADLDPTERWLRKAAADELAKDGVYDRAAGEQLKLIALLESQAREQRVPGTMMHRI